MEVQGRIKIIETTKQRSEKFKNRDIVVVTDEKYPQFIKIEFQQDNCDKLDGFEMGQEVKIAIELQGREWINAKDETVYFNTIKGYKIDLLDTSKQSPETPIPSFKAAPDADTDLPF